MRFLAAFALLACLTPPLDAAVFDHYDPIALNESAVAYMHDGDWDTARILLERAALLAPHDERIRRKLQELKAQMDGSPHPPSTAVSPGKGDPERAPGATGNRLLHEPPAIWKAK